MSSLNDYIRFALDIEDHNIVFKDYFYKILNGTKYKIYEAELIQPACPFCGSVILIHNGHLQLGCLSKGSNVVTAVKDPWLKAAW